MDFLTLNFDQLLHLLDNELIRNFEKQKNKIISAQYGIPFNHLTIHHKFYTTKNI